MINTPTAAHPDPNNPNVTGKTQQQVHQEITDAANTAAPSWMTGNLNRGNPLPWESYLPNEIANSPDSLAARNLKNVTDPGYLTGRALSGVGDASTSNMGAGNALGADSAMGSAIAKRYQSGLGNKLASIQSQVQGSAPTMQSQELNRAAQMFGSDQANAQANFKEQFNYETQREQIYNQWRNGQSAAEANTIGQVIGGAVAAGTLVFSMAGGGA